MSLLGIDVGSSSCKGVVFSDEGRVLASASRPYETYAPVPDQMEIDASEFWVAVAGVCRELASALGAETIKALAVSSHGETIVPLDAQGNAAGPAIMSSDHRSDRQAGDLAGLIGAEEIYRITGSPVHAMYGLCKMVWLRENDPGYYGRIGRCVSVPAYILSKMGFEPLTDYSLAARTMAFDIHKKNWSSVILDAAGINPSQLDVLRPSGSLVGRLSPGAAEELGLKPGTIVAMGGHDQPCGALGAGVIDSGQVCDSAGTYECLSAVSDRPADTGESIRMNLNSYCHVVPGRYITLAFFPAAIASQWFLDQFCYEDRVKAERQGRTIHEVMAERVQQLEPGPSGVCFTPHLVGSFNPRWNVNARGVADGLSFSTSRHSLYKAVFEGIACELSLNVLALEAAVGKIGAIRIFGGNARSGFTVRLRADVTGRDMVLLDTSEAVCRGAAFLAGIGAGIYRDAQDAVTRGVRFAETVSPDPAMTALYASQASRYGRVYNALYGDGGVCGK